MAQLETSYLNYDTKPDKKSLRILDREKNFN